MLSLYEIGHTCVLTVNRQLEGLHWEVDNYPEVNVPQMKVRMNALKHYFRHRQPTCKTSGASMATQN